MQWLSQQVHGLAAALESASYLQLGLAVVAHLVVGPIVLYVSLVVVLGALQGLLGLVLSASGLTRPSAAAPKERHVVVTGGSSGIGLEVARLYLQQGEKVTIMARDKKKLAAAKDDLAAFVAGAAPRIQAISCDVSSSEEEVKKAFASATAAFGDVDILVNVAGTSIAGDFDGLPEAEFERMLRINVLGSVFPTRAVVAGMKKNRRGTIVFVSSQVAQAAIHGYTAYGASKWALKGLAEALQMELKPYNINVAISYPPDTDTPGYKEEMLTKPGITELISATGYVFSPKDVAKDIVYSAAARTYHISSGFDGWMLKQAHGGMSPVNSSWEVAQQILLASLMRFVAVFYVLYWDYLVASYVHGKPPSSSSSSSSRSGAATATAAATGGSGPETRGRSASKSAGSKGKKKD